MLFRIISYAFITLIGPWASAQVPLLNEPVREVPRLQQGGKFLTPQAFIKLNKLKVPTTDQATSTYDVDSLAKTLDQQFQAALQFSQMAPPTCDSKEAVEYALALQISGKLDECAQYAAACSMDSKLTSPLIILRGALCEASRFRYKEANTLFEGATNSRFSQSPEYSEALYQYASYAMYGSQEALVPKILAKHPQWSSAEQKLWQGLLKRVAQSDLGELKKEQVDTFLDQQIALNKDTFNALLLSLKIRIAYVDHVYEPALAHLRDYAPLLKNPLLWYDLAYNITYYGLDTKFAEARKIYDVFDKYSNPWWNFPVENNTYNYTEIYGSVCTKNLLQGDDHKRFSEFKDKLRSGEIAADQALIAAAAFAKEFPDRADVLTTYGGIFALLNRHQEAINTYWQAHLLCRYYHRANWGLVLEKRYVRYSGLSDYTENEKKVEAELASFTIPPEISKYILNWSSLSAPVQTRVQYGSRIWLQYMKTLNTNSFAAYIKYAFDLLSDSPGLADFKDLRIGGVNYPHDNRLWDDVRGLGGENVVADLSEVFQTVQGDYNLLGHEIAHQFQSLLEKSFQPGLNCVQKLYDNAKTANNFPDAYSSYNKEEHFAQGVTYAMIPIDAPQRFGLNRSWLVKNNPEQLKFIESIEVAGGDLEKLSCPL